MDKIDEYCAQHTSAPDSKLNDIYRSIALHTVNPNMSSSPYQGTLLQMLTQLASPTIAVEIGSYAGYGAVSIARGLPQGGLLHVIEANEEYEEMILHHAQMAEVSDRIQLHIGQALDLIPTLPDGIGLAFVDADKINYENYYNLLLPKMRPGALLIFDNMLWYGRVITSPETQLPTNTQPNTPTNTPLPSNNTHPSPQTLTNTPQPSNNTHPSPQTQPNTQPNTPTDQSQLRCDRSTRIIQHLNQLITSDPRVQNILLPLRDGLMLCLVNN